MKIFISSLIAGFGPERQAVKLGVTTLRHEPVMAEDFGALPTSPQIACLQGLRQSDMVILVLGGSYGAVQPGSGLSATHEEYREARQTKPVLAFVQQGVTPDPQQTAFIAEVQGWEGGLFRGGFNDPADLQSGVIRALHDNAVATVLGAVDPDELTRRAAALIPSENRSTVSTTSLDLAVAAGPTQRILRPVEIEAPALADSIPNGLPMSRSPSASRVQNIGPGAPNRSTLQVPARKRAGMGDPAYRFRRSRAPRSSQSDLWTLDAPDWPVTVLDLRRSAGEHATSGDDRSNS